MRFTGEVCAGIGFGFGGQVKVLHDGAPVVRLSANPLYCKRLIQDTEVSILYWCIRQC